MSGRKKVDSDRLISTTGMLSDTVLSGLIEHPHSESPKGYTTAFIYLTYHQVHNLDSSQHTEQCVPHIMLSKEGLLWLTH
jgi:hypothetical protein